MGFLDPLYLWLGALVAPLVLLYILKVRREDARVSSTLLWESALAEMEAQIPFRRLRRDWLLLLQLLILLLLALAAAGPFRRGLMAPGERSAIVLDASAGMLAAERFEKGRRAALRVVGGMGEGDESLVILAGPEPEVLAPLTADRRALREAIEGATAWPAPADLEEALLLARQILGDEGTLLLITDGAAGAPDLAGMKVLSVGEPADNAGIVALGVRPSDPSGASHEAFVRVRNASREPVHGTLRILVEGMVRDAASVHIPAGGEAARTLQLEGISEGLIEVSWESEGDDALPLDDNAVWVLRRPEPRRYRISGDADPYVRRALLSDPEWVEARPGQRIDLEILVGRSPESEGPPFLWIDPLEGREGIAVGGSILDWERTHPALRFVDMHPVRLGRVPRFRRPAGARVLAESTAGPLLMEGIHEGRRYLLWAFDPMETDLPLRAAFPLLVRNTLEHLAPARGKLPGGVPTGVSPQVPWPSGEEVRLISPSHREVPVAITGGALHIPPMRETGVWRLVGAEREIRFAASLLDEGETELSPRAPAESKAARARPESVAAPRATLRGLWRPLALAALALLFLEGAAYHRRWSP
jgi:hypothetical protein